MWSAEPSPPRTDRSGREDRRTSKCGRSRRLLPTDSAGVSVRSRRRRCATFETGRDLQRPLRKPLPSRARHRERSSGGAPLRFPLPASLLSDPAMRFGCRRAAVSLIGCATTLQECPERPSYLFHPVFKRFIAVPSKHNSKDLKKAANLVTEIGSHAHQLSSGPENGADLVAFDALHPDFPIPPGANNLRQAKGIVAVALVDLHAEDRLGMPSIEADNW